MVLQRRLAASAVESALVGLPDGEVARRVLAGEPALFEVLMRRYNQRVYRAVRSVLRDERECEDAMQQAWLHAYAHLGQFRGAAAFSTWLTRIALNEALARLRRGSRPGLPRAVEEDDLMGSTLEDPERRTSDRELGRMLEEAVDRLPEGYRRVFVLRQVDGMSTAEAAAVLEVSEEVVKVRLHRAHLALRDLLYARAGPAAPGIFTFLGARCDRMVACVLGRILGPPPAA
ncbi:MAG TPA: RNA polymerase sigma factor [Anaeromyxobacteraceae bacterium]|nr:RNA polymerase sigma factor [Anaeromyxobacteraceae bacterium]